MTPDAQQPQPKLKSYTGAYIMYLSDGKLIVTGREKYKNFKAVFPLHEVDDYLSTIRPHTPTPETTEIIGLLATVEGFVPTAIRSEVMRLRERLTESLRRTAQEQS